MISKMTEKEARDFIKCIEFDPVFERVTATTSAPGRICGMDINLEKTITKLKIKGFVENDSKDKFLNYLNKAVPKHEDYEYLKVALNDVIKEQIEIGE